MARRPRKTHWQLDDMAGGFNDMQMNSYWKWKCEGCGFEFILTLVRIPEACHRCGGEWFLKIGEAATKEHRTD